MTGGLWDVYTFSEEIEKELEGSKDAPDSTGGKANFPGRSVSMVSTRQHRNESLTPPVNPFRESFEENKRASQSFYSQDTPPPVDAPPNYLENRTAYTQTPNNVLRKRRKPQQMPQKFFPFPWNRADDPGGGVRPATIMVQDAKKLGMKKDGIGILKGETDVEPNKKSEFCGNIKCECIIL